MSHEMHLSHFISIFTKLTRRVRIGQQFTTTIELLYWDKYNFFQELNAVSEYLSSDVTKNAYGIFS